MMATLVASLRENDYSLPFSRTEIYEKRFQLLTENWDKVKKVARRTRIHTSDKIRLLSRLALKIHKEHRRRFKLIELGHLWNQGFKRAYPNVDLPDVVWELQTSSNLIYSEGIGEYSLGHLSYQEFLTAKCIVNSQQVELLLDNLSATWWRQVLIFYAGIAGDIAGLFERIQRTRPFDGKDSLLQEMVDEARYTPDDLKNFISELNN